MGVIIGVGVVIASIFGAALSQQAADEFKAWVPWLVERLLRSAVLRLPALHRKRMDEEWRSHIGETPGHIGKLIVALGIVVASHRMDHILALSLVADERPSQKSPTIYEGVDFTRFKAGKIGDADNTWGRSIDLSKLVDDWISSKPKPGERQD